jgi:hypothetical protein
MRRWAEDGVQFEHTAAQNLTLADLRLTLMKAAYLRAKRGQRNCNQQAQKWAPRRPV